METNPLCHGIEDVKFKQIVRRCFNDGIPLRESLQDVLALSLTSDEFLEDVKRIKHGFITKCLVMTVLAVVGRVALVPSIEFLLPATSLDFALFGGGCLVCLALIYVTLKTLPLPWTMHSQSPSIRTYRWSDGLYLWLECLLCDRPPNLQIMSTMAKSSFTHHLSLLWQNEFYDGISRQRERQQLLCYWFRQSMADVQHLMKQKQLWLPVTELMIAVWLAIGICAVPAVQFIERDGTIGGLFTEGEGAVYDD